MTLQTNSIIQDTYDGKTLWTTGGAIKSDDWSADDLTILRAYEWDRINFTDPKKLAKTAKRMKVSIEELNVIRKRTLDYARKTLVSRQSSRETSEPVTKAADIALVK